MAVSDDQLRVTSHECHPAGMTLVEMLVSSLLPATLGLIGVWVGSMVSKRADHRHWLRERKVQAVSSLVEAASLLSDRLRYDAPGNMQERAQWLHALQSGRTAIHLLCKPETIDSTEALVARVKAIEKEQTDEAMAQGLAALRVFIAQARSEVLSYSELRG